MIASAYSKSSNSSGFNPILEKFCEMIRAIIVLKTMCRIFLIFCRSSFINISIVKNNFWNLKIAEIKISRDPFIQKKLRYTVLKIIYAQISWKNYFLEKNLFQGLGAFFASLKPLVWASYF